MTDGPDKTMLGSGQKDWFKERLKASTAPFKFIITSVPFHGSAVDTWGPYRTERDELAGFIRGEKIRGTIFLTGDYHLARDLSNAKTGLREYMAGTDCLVHELSILAGIPSPQRKNRQLSLRRRLQLRAVAGRSGCRQSQA